MSQVVFELKVQRDDSGALTTLVNQFDAADKGSKKAGASVFSFNGILKGLQSEATSSAQGLSGATGALGSIAAAAGPAGLAIAAVGGAFVAVGASIAGLVSHFATVTGGLTDMAAKTGLSTTALQEFRNTAGVATESVSAAVGMMQQKLASGEAAFGRLGLNIKELQGMAPADAFREVAAAVASIENPMLRTAAATDVFGKLGKESLPFIIGGMSQASARAHELGGVMDEASVAAGDRLGDALDDASYAFSNLLTNLGAVLAKTPNLIEGIEGIAKAIGTLARAVQDNEQWIRRALLVATGGASKGIGELAGYISAGASLLPGDIHAGTMLGPTASGSGRKTPGGTYVTDAEAKAAEDLKKARARAAEERKKAEKKLEDDIFGIHKWGWDADKKLQEERARVAGANAKRMLDELVANAKTEEELIKDKAKWVEAQVEEELREREKVRKFMQDERKARADEAKAARDAAKDVADGISGLAASFVSLGMSQNQGLNDLVTGLGHAAEAYNAVGAATTNMGRATAIAQGAMQIAADNAHNRDATAAALSGAASGAAMGAQAGGLYGAVAGAVIGGFIGATSGAAWRDAARTAADVLGAEVSDALLTAMQQTLQQNVMSNENAALVHLGQAITESGRSADTFGAPMLNLIEQVRVGAIPASVGIGALGDAFAVFARQAEESGEMASQAMVDAMRSARALGQEVPGMEAWTDRWLKQATDAMTKLTGVIDGGRVLGGIEITTEEQAAASAEIFNSTFWAMVEEQGIVAATDAMGPAFDALKKQIEDAFGSDVATALLGGAGQMFDFADNPAVRAGLEAATALKDVIEGLANAGYLTKTAFDAFGTSAQTTFATLTAGGMSDKQALEAMAPTLANILEAHERYGFEIDANTQALIDQARAAGIAFPTDPIYMMVDAVHELINAIRVANGLPPITWGLPTLPNGNAPSNSNPDPLPTNNKTDPYAGDPGGAPPGPGAAAGGIYSGPSSGYWALLHDTEMVTPYPGPGGKGKGKTSDSGQLYMPGDQSFSMEPGSLPPGPWGGGEPRGPDPVLASLVSLVSQQQRPIEIKADSPIIIQESPLGREGRQEMRDESVRGMIDALWARNQDLVDALVRALPAKGA